MSLRRRLYPGKVVRVLTPRMVEVRIDLGFGVSITRELILDGAPTPESEQWELAKRGLIWLTNGMAVYVQCDSMSREPKITGTLFVKTKNPKADFVEVIEQQAYADAAGFMRYAAMTKFADITALVREIRSAGENVGRALS